MEFDLDADFSELRLHGRGDTFLKCESVRYGYPERWIPDAGLGEELARAVGIVGVLDRWFSKMTRLAFTEELCGRDALTGSEGLADPFAIDGKVQCLTYFFFVVDSRT